MNDNAIRCGCQQAENCKLNDYSSQLNHLGTALLRAARWDHCLCPLYRSMRWTSTLHSPGYACWGGLVLSMPTATTASVYSSWVVSVWRYVPDIHHALTALCIMQTPPVRCEGSTKWSQWESESNQAAGAGVHTAAASPGGGEAHYGLHEFMNDWGKHLATVGVY